jgi:hypothetical protein
LTKELIAEIIDMEESIDLMAGQRDYLKKENIELQNLLSSLLDRSSRLEKTNSNLTSNLLSLSRTKTVLIGTHNSSGRGISHSAGPFGRRK